MHKLNQWSAVLISMMALQASASSLLCNQVLNSGSDRAERFQREIVPLMKTANPRFAYLKKHLDAVPRVPIKEVKIDDLSRFGGNYRGQFRFIITTDRAEYKLDPRTGFIFLSKFTLDNVDLKDISFQELILSAPPKRHDKEPFVMNGDNSDVTIRSMRSLNGKDLKELEMELKPNKSSTAGFLGRNDSLKQTLLEDNQFVHQLNLTHQKVATPLLVIAQVAVLQSSSEVEFTYFSTRYRVHVTEYMGSQDSPFGDGISASADLTVTNLKTGDSITFSTMLGNLIYQYGFYEGRGTPYRVSPEAILRVFPFIWQI